MFGRKHTIFDCLFCLFELTNKENYCKIANHYFIVHILGFISISFQRTYAGRYCEERDECPVFGQPTHKI